MFSAYHCLILEARSSGQGEDHLGNQQGAAVPGQELRNGSDGVKVSSKGLNRNMSLREFSEFAQSLVTAISSPKARFQELEAACGGQ